MKCFICGITGKMGKELLSVSVPDINIVGGMDSQNYYDFHLNRLDHLPDFDVMIDFSHKSAINKVLDIALKTNSPLVIATTGHDNNDDEQIKKAALKIPILKTSNTSYGILILKKLAENASVMLPNWDCSIIEKHHKTKRDRPSGTAILLKNAIEQPGKRSIQIHAIRGGTIRGEHEIIFMGEDEVITLSHVAYSRKIFAIGALNAAKRLITMPAGLYFSV